MGHEIAGLHSAGMRLAMRAAIAVLVLAAVAYFAPRIAIRLFVSPSALSQSLKEAAEAQGGFLLEHTGEPEIIFWPRPRLRLTSPVLRRADGTVIAEGNRLSADIPMTAGLGGDTRFPAVRLSGLRVHAPGARSGNPGPTLLAQAAGLAAMLDPATLGAFNGIEGRLQVEGGAILPEDGGPPILSDLAADLAHLKADAQIEFRLSGTTEGKPVDLGIVIPAPGKLAAGAQSAVTVSAALPGLRGRFEGNVSLVRAAFASGMLTLEASDPAAFIAWGGLPAAGMQTLRTASLTASLGASLGSSGRTIRFDTFDLAVNDTRATGVLELALPEEGAPKASGTLAFADFDIDDVETLKPLAERLFVADAEGRLHPAANLDLRVSTRRAMIGGISLDEVAASMIVGQEHVLLDIGDSSFAGGRLTGRLSYGASSPQPKLQISLHDVNAEAVTGKLGGGNLWPRSGSVDMEASIRLANPLIKAGGVMDGTARFYFKEGVLPHLNAQRLRDAGNKAPMALSSISDGFAFETLDVKATFTSELASVDAEARNNQDILRLAGTRSRKKQLDIAGSTETIPVAGAVTRFKITGAEDTPALESFVSDNAGAKRP